MIKIQDICGEKFVIIHNHSFGKCFEQLCITYPVHLVLLISSSYYFGFRHIRQSERQILKNTIFILRMLLSLLFSLIGLYSLYKLLVKNGSVASDLIQALIITFTWAIHALYLLSLIKGNARKVHGSLIVNICVFLCFGGTTLHLYLQYKEKGFQSFESFEIINFISQIIYVATFLPNKCYRDGEVVEHSINVISEEEPLLTSAPCNYSAFREDSDPENLDTAENTNLFYRLFFVWVKPLMIKGFYNKLKTIDDLFDLPDSLQARHLAEKLLKLSENRFSSDFDSSSFTNSSAFKTLHLLFGCEFYLIGILKFLSDCFLFGGPLLLNGLVSNLEDGTPENWKYGYYYAVGLFLTTCCGSLCSTHYNYLINKISLKIKASLIMMTYEKTLYISKITLSSMSTGEIINFISTDTDRIVNFCQSFHQFWSLPIQVIIALVLLYQQVNYCFLIGIGFIIIVIPINQYIAKKIANYSTFLMFAKDKRIKV